MSEESLEARRVNNPRRDRKRVGAGRRRRTSLTLGVGSLFCAGLLLTPFRAAAIDDDFPAVGQCEWPSAVWLRATADASHPGGLNGGESYICSGVYVGNHIVLTAAHCIAYMSAPEVYFGESDAAPYWTQTQLTCKTHPDGDWAETATGVYNYVGKDVAYCELNPGHPSPPYAPVLVPGSCDNRYIWHELFGAGWEPYGEFVLFVGSGTEGPPPNSDYGTKRAAPGSVLSEKVAEPYDSLVVNNLAANGGTAFSVHAGDSGAPVLFEMPNGTWRVIGVAQSKVAWNTDLGDGMGQQV